MLVSALFGLAALVAPSCAASLSHNHGHSHAHNLVARAAADDLVPRADCRAINAPLTGAYCSGLAASCGITLANFIKFNPNVPCNAVPPTIKVCCTAGTMPVPQPQADGTCATRIVNAGNTCTYIAQQNGITAAQIISYNDKKVWGWQGCDKLQVGQTICLSPGTRPLPKAITGAVCGPQVPGTVKPAANVDIATLNPCPIKACCSVWGQCGINTDFCTPSGTGSPGTAAAGTNGCISNCGTAISNNVVAPTQFRKIGYFQAYNYQSRPCVNMNVTQMPKSFTHTHWSFATLTTDFQVVISAEMQEQFDLFKTMTTTKKILVIGGWAFSTSPSTYMIFRNMVASTANINKAVANIGNFLRTHNLDGVDFDWEYPASQDTAGIPAAPTNEGTLFLNFLKAMRANIPTKSLSLAVPASYHYLRRFPIGQISLTVDYIVLMTYDFYTQADYGLPAQYQNCPTGDCLRSHVSGLQTHDTLAMITKAGVAANKVVAGVASYGRVFKMAQLNCYQASCKFTGPESGAIAGRCTGETGILAKAEIDEIIATKHTAQFVLDGSDILIYGSTQYIAYMKEATKTSRIAQYKAWNFGGSADWAVDLQLFWENL